MKGEKIDKKNIEEILALTPMQEGMLFHHLKDPQGNFYLGQLCLEIAGKVDIQRFTAAWNFVVKTNEMLRTFFRWEQVKAPLQIILKESFIQLHYYDFSHKSGREIVSALEEVKKQEWAEGFDLKNIPFRAALCKIEEAKYFVIISNHHILYDGWSNGIILKEFFEAYNELSSGKSLRELKPAIKTKFKEFVQWIGGQDDDKDKKEREMAFWEDYLAGFAGETGIPLKRRKSLDMKDRAETSDYSIGFEPGIKRSLEGFCAGFNITAAELFYSVWGLLLQRYNNSDDVLFDTTISGRSAEVPGIEKMVGLFINTLPLRVRCYPGETLLGMLQTLHNTLQSRENYENTPLVKISQYSRGSYNEERVDSIVVVENYPLDIQQLQENSPLTIESYSMTESPHYDLTVVIRMFAGIDLHFSYQRGVFAENVIQRLGSHFLRMIHEILESPWQQTSRIDILSDKEKQLLLENFNNTTGDYPSDKTIPQLFEEQVERTPYNTAVVGPLPVKNRTYMTYITYRELDEKSRQLAKLLHKKGVKPDTIVGIMVHRSIEMIIGILGILKSGGAYLPIDPNYPEERMNYMLADSGAEILLTTPGLSKEIKYKIGIVQVTDAINRVPTPLHLHLEPAPANCLAYIIYTSGSTGQPKGVLVEQSSMVNVLWALQESYPFSGSDAYLLKTSYLFDVSVTELFGWIFGGGVLSILKPGGEKNPLEILNAIEKHTITHINFVPSMFTIFLEILNPGNIGKLSGLKYIFLAGEALLPELVNQFRRLNMKIVLENIYGPTEGTVYVSSYSLSQWDGQSSIPIGKPLRNLRLFILDRNNRLQPIGALGELCISGIGLARGYLNQPELTNKKFLRGVQGGGFYKKSPPGRRRLYRTGDLARWLPDGNIEFLGRMDNQIKIRGFRIELEEIENCLRRHDGVKEAAVVTRGNDQGNKYLSAYIVPESEVGSDELREHLSKVLPDYMVPSFFLQVKEIPLTVSGKAHRQALLAAGAAGTSLETGVEYVAPGDDYEKQIACTWEELLGVDNVGIHTNFFDIGGNSLLIIRLSSRLSSAFKRDIPVLTLFNYPTIALLARYLRGKEKEQAAGKVDAGKTGVEKNSNVIGTEGQRPGFEIAVIGMSGRFPGARNIEEFWENLKNGVESITFFSNEELIECEVDRELLDNPDYVYIPAKGVLAGIEYFDSLFFGYIPSEAKMMDPQVRIFHECCWEAVEDAGYDTETYEGTIGLYAGASSSIFWEVMPFREKGNSEPHWHSASQKWDALQYSDRAFLAGRIAYRLNLKGPCINVLSACSTSLVAIHLACRELSGGVCDIALAGGVSVTFEDEFGYLYMEGMIMSADGHCRAFDAKARGIVGGDGAGVVVLKPLAAAVADGDHIRAVIKGTAANNDGIQKAGFTAPGIQGQARVIRAAHQAAGVEPESITYIETHGTGTSLGDPIEIEALKQAFGINKIHVCAVGSVKTNIGHLDAAAGVAGFIKTVLALENRLIPPSLHFEFSNPKIQLENSPFYINTTLKEWKSHAYPLRAGVSSYGVGGTNAHVVLEEAPEGTRGLAPLPVERASGKYQLILLSAKTQSALDKMTENLAKYFKKNLLNRDNHENPTNPGPTLANAAYTLQVGRRAFNHRRMMVCSTADEAFNTLLSSQGGRLQTFFTEARDRPIIFMFPGQGSQYVNMGWGLYQKEPLFRQEMDRCFKILQPLMNCNIKEILYPESGQYRSNKSYRSYNTYQSHINQTEIAQPLIFTIEYALARMLIHRGIAPDAMIGHSIGEYTAACLSGLFSLADALKLVVLRGRMMQKMPSGVMLSVSLSEEELASLLIKELSLAAVNGPSTCVVSGEKSAIERFSRELTTKGHKCKVLYTSHAFHSRMMDPILKQFEDQVRKIRFNSTMQIPCISNLTGHWLDLKDASDPGYWARHLRQTVRFGEGLNTLFQKENAIFLEVGPGQVLSTLVRQGANKKPGQFSINLVRQPNAEVCDHYYLINNIGSLWLYGVNINWKTFHAVEKRHRISLPSYPFECRHYPIPKGLSNLKIDSGKPMDHSFLLNRKKLDMADWFYIPYWEYSPEPPGTNGKTGELSEYLIFMDESGLGSQMEKRLKSQGHGVTTVRTGEINPGEITGYDRLLDELRQQDRLPKTIIHLWSVDDPGEQGSEIQVVEKNLEVGFYSLLYLAQALIKQNLTHDILVEVVTNNMHEVTGSETLYPGKVMILGLNKVIPQEYPHINCRSIDIVLPGTGRQREQLVDQLLLEFSAASSNPVIAYRNGYRWEQHFKPLRLDEALEGQSGLREEGVYLVTGGLGNIGLVLAEHMAKSVKAKLILTGRSAFPTRSEWEEWLQSHGSKNRISRKIEKLLEMEKAGARILVCQADVSHPQQMQRAIAQAEESFGRINGVIHSAGLLGETMFRSVKDLDKTWCQEQFRPKVHGVLALEEILRDRDLDFCVLMSSTSAILGGLGFAAYSAANLFMDAWTHKHNRTHPISWISVNWDSWQVGEERKSGEQLGGSVEALSMSPGEGTRAFQRILSLGKGRGFTARIIQSAGDLQTRIDRWVKRESPGRGEDFEDEQSVIQEARPPLLSPYVAPVSREEQIMADTWKELFGYAQVGILDNFFELGGDSLKATTVVSKIHKVLNVQIPLNYFFTNPTIKALAQYMGNTKEITFSPIIPVEKKEYYPLSSSQKRMFILQQVYKESTGYNLTSAMIVEGDIERKRLEDTSGRLIKRHESYRTSFLLLGEQPVQRIHQNVAFEIEYHDLTTGGKQNTEDKSATSPSSVIRHLSSGFIRPFDLSCAPLLRVGLIKTGEKKYFLIIDTHHIVSDGESQAISIQDFLTLYLREPLTHLPIQYKDFSEWQNPIFEAGKAVIQAQQEHWLKEFNGKIPELNLPLDYPRPTIKSFEGESLGFVIEEELTGKLKELTGKTETTLNMLLLAVYNILLFKYTRQEDIIVGMPVNGRTHADLQNIVGMFVNMLPIRNQPQGSKTFRSFLIEVKKKVLAALENQDYQFEELVKNLGLERNISTTPLVNVVFEMVNFDSEISTIKLARDKLDMKMILEGSAHRNAVFDLILMVGERSGIVEIELVYAKALFKSAAVKKITWRYISILQQVVENDEIKLEDIKLSHELRSVKSNIFERQSEFGF